MGAQPVVMVKHHDILAGCLGERVIGCAGDAAVLRPEIQVYPGVLGREGFEQRSNLW